MIQQFCRNWMLNGTLVVYMTTYLRISLCAKVSYRSSNLMKRWRSKCPKMEGWLSRESTCIRVAPRRAWAQKDGRTTMNARRKFSARRTGNDTSRKYTLDVQGEHHLKPGPEVSCFLRDVLPGLTEVYAAGKTTLYNKKKAIHKEGRRRKGTQF